jgi:hypothetical protein
MSTDLGHMGSELRRDEILRARQMPPEAKLSAGFELFEYACEITRAGIRAQFPDADEQEVERQLARRLAMKQQLEIGSWKFSK